MLSSRTMPAILFFLWTLIAHCSSEGCSEDLIHDFFTVISGDFDNFDQDREEGDHHDRYAIRAQQVLVPALQEEPMVYAEESMNGSVYRMIVLNVTQLPNTNIVTFTYFNFTEPTKHKPGSFNPDCLANYPREQFHRNEGCLGYYEQLARGIFVGETDDCRHRIKAHHPTYYGALTCDGVRFASPSQAYETTTTLPYYLKRRGCRHPLKFVPKDYVSPC